MKKFRLALLAATAATLVTAGAANAQVASNNNAGIDQQGSDNVADITQSGTDNDFNNTGGTAAAVQNGDDNSIVVLQSGNDNTIGLTNPNVVQDGDFNSFEATQSSNNNVIGSVQQDSQSVTNVSATQGNNQLTIEQQNAEFTKKGASAGTLSNAPGLTDAGNTVNKVSQTTKGAGNNIAVVNQNGNSNKIEEIKQINTGANNNKIEVDLIGNENGSNGFTNGTKAASVGVAHSTLIQDGTNNDIELYALGNDNRFGVTQTGDANTLSVIDVLGSNNQLGIQQDTKSITGSNSLTVTGISGDTNNIGVKPAWLRHQHRYHRIGQNLWKQQRKQGSIATAGRRNRKHHCL